MHLNNYLKLKRLLMRRCLDHLYQISGYIAAFFMVMIGLTIVGQICGRFVGIAIDSTETAGFSMAAMTFFGLAYTFRQGEHIRVTLFLRFASGRIKKLLDLFAVGFCVIFISYLTYWAFDFVYFSYKFDEISQGLLAIPFWIPRLAMALGSLIFLIALSDEFFSVLKGGIPSYEENASPVYGEIEEPKDIRGR